MRYMQDSVFVEQYVELFSAGNFSFVIFKQLTFLHLIPKKKYTQRRKVGYYKTFKKQSEEDKSIVQ